MSSPEREPPLLDDPHAVAATAELFRAWQDGRFADVFAEQCARDRVSNDWHFLLEMGAALERVMFRADGKRRTHADAGREARRVVMSLRRRAGDRADVAYFAEFFDGLASSMEQRARAYWRPPSRAELFGFLVGIAKTAEDRGITIHPNALPALAKAIAERMPRATRPSGSITDFMTALAEHTRSAPLAKWIGRRKRQ